MKYVNRKGEIIKLADFKYLDAGGCAHIYCDNSTVFKIYKKDTLPDCRINNEIFDILKDINNPNFVKLYETYTSISLYKKLLSHIHPTEFRVDAYTSKFYQKEDIDPISISKDYLLSNLDEIERLFDELAKYKIKVEDVNQKNTIYTKDSIVIIDPDLFCIYEYPIASIKVWNKISLLKLFKSIINYSNSLYFTEKNNYLDWIKDNFHLHEINENTNITKEISNKLQYVKRPIDFVRK